MSLPYHLRTHSHFSTQKMSFHSCLAKKVMENGFKSPGRYTKVMPMVGGGVGGSHDRRRVMTGPTENDDSNPVLRPHLGKALFFNFMGQMF